MGELGLMPQQFWRLTVREFYIKVDAFRRMEDRRESEGIRQALRTVSYKKNDKSQMERAANALRRYPLKKWLLPDELK